MGNWIAPPRFILFLVVLIVASAVGKVFLGWLHGLMIGFDVAAITFLAVCTPLLTDCSAAVMRRHADANDANRAVLLGVTGAVTAVILITIGAELLQGHPPGIVIALIVATLICAWLFSNFVYALHYAHMFYLTDKRHGKDTGGVQIPGTSEPDYWDFIYFSFTLGMTFQTSDTAITSGRYRRVVTMHCLAAFVFNIGVLAFTINVLGGGGGGG